MIPRRRADTTPEEIARFLERLSMYDSSEAGCKPSTVGSRPSTVGAVRDDDQCRAFETAICQYTGAEHCALTNSGRQAMSLIFQHLGLMAGDEVVVPAFTLAALVPLIQSFGATVKPADVSLEHFNVTAESIERRLSARTKAVLVLHAFGMPAPMGEIMALCRERQVVVIEDCAHGLGGRFDGQSVGTFGWAGFFSFESTKPVNTFGGGAVISANEALCSFVREAMPAGGSSHPVIKKARAVRSEGFMFSTGAGYPMLALLAIRLTRGPMKALYRLFQAVPPRDVPYFPVQAALGMEKLATLDERIAARARLVSRYAARLPKTVTLQRMPLREGMSDGVETRTPFRSSWYFLVARLPGAAFPIRRQLLWKGIDAGVEDEVADDVAALLDFADCPNAADLSRRAIVLPLYDGLSHEDVDYVCQSLAEVLS